MRVKEPTTKSGHGATRASEPRRLAITSLVAGIAGCATIATALILARMAGEFAHPILTYTDAIGLVCGVGAVILGYNARAAIRRISAQMDGVGVRKSAAQITAERRSLAGMVLGWAGIASLVLLTLGASVSEEGRDYAPNEARAIDSLRSITSANAVYFRTCHGSFVTRLSELGPPKVGQAADCHAASLIEPLLASGTKLGYKFTYLVKHLDEAGAVDGYILRADPVIRGLTGQRSFYSDESGVIRSSAKAIATAEDGPIE